MRAPSRRPPWRAIVFGLFGFWLAINSLAARPTIVTVNPASGGPGTVVTISGQNFGIITRVLFNNTEAPIVDRTTLSVTAVVPNQATSGAIYIYDQNNGFDYTRNPFLVTPRITNFDPVGGQGGAQVLINGVNLSNLSYNAPVFVWFNGIPAFNIFVSSDNFIYANAPYGGTSGPLTIQTLAGVTTSTQNFFYLPIVQKLDKNYAAVGDKIVIAGTSMTGIDTVLINGASAEFTVQSATNVLATVPTGATTQGLVQVGNPLYFSAGLPFYLLPKIDSFTPSNGPPGTIVVLRGTGIKDVKGLTIGGAAVLVGTNFPPTRFDAIVPQGVATGPIRMVTATGTNSTTALFYAPPVISNFSPAKGAIGTRVTINGINFTNATAVEFGSVSAPLISATATQIITEVPASAVSSKIRVTTPGGSANSASNFVVEGQEPQITDFFPSFGLAGTRVTIVGTKFTGATSVTFNGIAAPPVSVEDTRVIALVPAGATTGRIRVISPAGTGESPRDFLVGDRADLSIQATRQPVSPTVGQTVTFHIEARNGGPLPAAGTTANASLSANLTDITAEATIGSPDVLGQSVAWDVGTLGNQAAGILTVRAKISVAGQHSLNAQVQSDIPDFNGANNSVTLQFTIGIPTLTIAKVSPNQVRLSWPSTSVGFVLQKSLLLSAVSWQPVTETPVVENGEYVILTNPTELQQYYRLLGQ